MLSSNCAAFRVFSRALQLPWRKTQRVNLERFAAAFLTRRALPVRRLARTLAKLPGQTKREDKRLRRFLGNDRLHLNEALRAYLRFLCGRFGPLPYIPVMLDWTFVNEHAILTAAIPYRGRSLPLFDTVHERSIEKRVYSQTQAEIALLRRLRWCWPAAAPPPLLLADRGFDKSRLLEWLLFGTCGRRPEDRAPSAPGSHPWLFIIRSTMRARVTDAQGAPVELPKQLLPDQVRCFPDLRYHLEGQFPLNLVASGGLDPKTKEPVVWFLATNLPAAELRRVPHFYAKRMQPEQTYRDLKTGYHLTGFGLRAARQMRRDRLERLCFLTFLVYGFLVLLAESERTLRDELFGQHFRVSLVTYALDILVVVPHLAYRIARDACARVTLLPDWPESGDP